MNMNNIDKGKNVKAIVARLKANCDEAEFELFRCPTCGKRLILTVHPNRRGFYLRCSTSSVHFGIHDEHANAPSWWEKYVRDGWLD